LIEQGDLHFQTEIPLDISGVLYQLGKTAADMQGPARQPRFPIAETDILGATILFLPMRGESAACSEQISQ